MNDKVICIWMDCNLPLYGNKLCKKHYQRVYKGHKINQPSIGDRRRAVREGNYYKIPLGLNAKDGYTLVDEEYAHLDKYKWNITNDGYAKAVIESYAFSMSQMIMGKAEKGYVIDHINRDRLDNRLNNLRYITIKENSYNRRKPREGSSRYKGVSRKINRYVSVIGSNGLTYHIGSYKTEIEAALSYDCAALQLHGNIAYTNILFRDL